MIIVATALCLAIASTAWAQVNIEKFRNKKGVAGKVDVQFGGAAGNSDFFDVGANTDITLNTESYTALLIGRGMLGFASGKRFDNQGLIHLRLTWTAQSQFQPEMFLQSDYARPRKLVARLLVGGGLRTVLLADENRHISLGSSLMWEREDYDLSSIARHPDSDTVVRSSNYLNLQLEKGVELNTSGYYQFAINDITDARILGQVEITSPIFGFLKQSTSLRLRLDTDPPDGVEKNDFHIGTSFGLQF